MISAASALPIAGSKAQKCNDLEMKASVPLLALPRQPPNGARKTCARWRRIFTAYEMYCSSLRPVSQSKHGRWSRFPLLFSAGESASQPASQRTNVHSGSLFTTIVSALLTQAQCSDCLRTHSITSAGQRLVFGSKPVSAAAHDHRPTLDCWSSRVDGSTDTHARTHDDGDKRKPTAHASERALDRAGRPAVPPVGFAREWLEWEADDRWLDGRARKKNMQRVP